LVKSFVAYPDVLGLFGIFGGIFASSVGLIIPFTIKFIIEGKRGYKWWHPCRFMYALIVIVVVIIGLGSAYVSIFESVG
jgi:hypothetical protein